MTFIVQHLSDPHEDPDGDDATSKLDALDLTSILNTIHEVRDREARKHCVRVDARISFEQSPDLGAWGTDGVALNVEFHHVEDI
jgi:hypothetical protein